MSTIMPIYETKDETQQLVVSSKKRLKKNDFLKIIVLCLDITCHGMSATIITSFFPNTVRALGIDLTDTGIIFSAYSLASMILSPFLPYLMNKVGRKVILMFSLLLMCLSLLPFAYTLYLPDRSSIFATCLICRIGLGIAYVNCQISVFSIATTDYPDRISLILGLLEMGFSTGLSSGPALGGILFDKFGFHGPFFFLICLSLIFIILTAAFVKLDDIEDTERENVESSNPNSKKLSYKKLFASPLIFMPLVAGTISFFVDFGIGLILPSFLNDEYDLTPSYIGVIFFIAVGVYSILSPFVGYFLDKKGNHALVLIIGYILTAISLFFILLLPQKGNHALVLIIGYILTAISLFFMGSISFFNDELKSTKYAIFLTFTFVGISFMYVPVIGLCLKNTQYYDIAINNETKNQVSSMCVLFGNIGLSLGSFLCGLFSENFGFKTTSLILSIITASLGIISVFVLLRKTNEAYN